MTIARRHNYNQNTSANTDNSAIRDQNNESLIRATELALFLEMLSVMGSMCTLAMRDSKMAVFTSILQVPETSLARLSSAMLHVNDRIGGEWLTDGNKIEIVWRPTEANIQKHREFCTRPQPSQFVSENKFSAACA